MARVLIVDDEPRIRDLIREHLQYAGFTKPGTAHRRWPSWQTAALTW